MTASSAIGTSRRVDLSDLPSPECQRRGGPLGRSGKHKVDQRLRHRRVFGIANARLHSASDERDRREHRTIESGDDFVELIVAESHHVDR